MRTSLNAYKEFQVFLNYPYDEAFAPFARAMHFAVVAGGHIPVCAQDFISPDKPRLETIVEAIVNCSFSVHDLSRGRGEGPEGYARLNMPLEVGMALFHAVYTQRTTHRCAFFTPVANEFRIFISDLAGLDPSVYGDEPANLAAAVYDWLRTKANPNLFTDVPTADVKEAFQYYETLHARLKGSGDGACPVHDESQELMFQVCTVYEWWDWRNNKGGTLAFPSRKLSWKGSPPRIVKP